MEALMTLIMMLILLSVILMGAGYIWGLIEVAKVNRWGWFVALLLFGVIIYPLLAICHWRVVRLQFSLCMVGCVVFFFAIAVPSVLTM